MTDATISRLSTHDLSREMANEKMWALNELLRALLAPAAVVAGNALTAMFTGDQAGPDWLDAARYWLNVVAAFVFAGGIVYFGRRAFGHFVIYRAIARELKRRG